MHADTRTVYSADERACLYKRTDSTGVYARVKSQTNLPYAVIKHHMTGRVPRANFIYRHSLTNKNQISYIYKISNNHTHPKKLFWVVIKPHNHNQFFVFKSSIRPACCVLVCDFELYSSLPLDPKSQINTHIHAY